MPVSQKKLNSMQDSLVDSLLNPWNSDIEKYQNELKELEGYKGYQCLQNADETSEGFLKRLKLKVDEIKMVREIERKREMEGYELPNIHNPYTALNILNSLKRIEKQLAKITKKKKKRGSK